MWVQAPRRFSAKKSERFVERLSIINHHLQLDPLHYPYPTPPKMVKLTEVEDEHFSEKPSTTKDDALLVSDDDEDYSDTGSYPGLTPIPSTPETRIAPLSSTQCPIASPREDFSVLIPLDHHYHCQSQCPHFKPSQTRYPNWGNEHIYPRMNTYLTRPSMNHRLRDLQR
mgnify:CR=1 FL=1|jgi:hypothetical protein